jgi:hypothetical protein
MEEEFRTLYRSRPPDKGWGAPIHRRQVRDFFGNAFFGYVKIIEPHFQGWHYYGSKEIKWSGVPVACATFPLNLEPSDDLFSARWRCLPSLTVFAVRSWRLEEETWPDLLPAFETIKQEWQAWVDTPETGRLHRPILLFTVDEGELLTFRGVR